MISAMTRDVSGVLGGDVISFSCSLVCLRHLSAYALVVMAVLSLPVCAGREALLPYIPYTPLLFLLILALARASSEYNLPRYPPH